MVTVAASFKPGNEDTLPVSHSAAYLKVCSKNPRKDYVRHYIIKNVFRGLTVIRSLGNKGGGGSLSISIFKICSSDLCLSTVFE